MRLYFYSVLVLLTIVSYSQDSIRWEPKIDIMAPFTNNLTFGIEKRFKGSGIQLDFGFPLQIFRYDGNIVLVDVPEEEKYDEGYFFKVSYKNYNVLSHDRRYMQIQFMNSSYGNDEERLYAYGFFLGIGERQKLGNSRLVLDYYVSLGLGSSSRDTRNYHFGFYTLGGLNPMISLGVSLGLPFY